MSSFWKNKKVLITGGAGFIGSNLMRRLLDEGASIRAVDNLERGRLEWLKPMLARVDFRQCDLRRYEQALDAVRGVDVTFHLASKVGGIKVYLDYAGTVLNQNLLMDQNIFAAIVETKMPSLFYASTSHVYPEGLQQSPDARPLVEADAHPASPGLSYGWGKLLGEITLQGMAKEHDWLRVSMARIVGAYGPNQDIDIATGSVIPVFCHRAIQWPAGAPFRILGTGAETRSYCFVADIVDGLMRSVEAQTRMKVVGPFNLGAEGRVTIREIGERIVKISGKEIPLAFDESAKTMIWGQAVDCALARKLLDGWTPKTDFDTGLRHTYQHIEQRLAAA
ncbi:MAG: SDR family NAD(P)-dependent oxidoreductase [Verrucomicrobia bacterium]|nr:SDR family NAD(P)-dependent oxidoreductase [Verrucomicrobiota bacterium]